MLPILVSLALAGALPALPPWQDGFPRGWSASGEAIAWDVGGVEQGETFSLLLVTDERGRPQALYRRDRYSHDRDEHISCEAQRCLERAWEEAQPEEAGEKWLAEHPPKGKRASHQLPRIMDSATDRSGPEPLELGMAERGSGCPVIALTAKLGGVSGTVAEDRCASDGPRSEAHGSSVQVVWSPDGRRAALAWHLARYYRGEGLQPVMRLQLLVLTRRTLAGVALLDAGAGKGVAALSARLEEAGFRVAHRGKASQPRKATEIYFAAGFEEEAREVAVLLGAAPAAVKPLDWKSPHAITVAAGEP